MAAVDGVALGQSLHAPHVVHVHDIAVTDDGNRDGVLEPADAVPVSGAFEPFLARAGVEGDGVDAFALAHPRNFEDSGLLVVPSNLDRER